jgi:hypothetical protein
LRHIIFNAASYWVQVNVSIIKLSERKVIIILVLIPFNIFDFFRIINQYLNVTYCKQNNLLSFFYITQEGLSKITSQKDKLVATVQLMWGGSPVYGVAEQGNWRWFITWIRKKITSETWNINYKSEILPFRAFRIL